MARPTKALPLTLLSLLPLLPLLSTLAVSLSPTHLNQTIHQARRRNPLSGHLFQVDRDYNNNLRRTIRRTTGPTKAKLRRLLHVPTAFWLANKRSIENRPDESNAAAVLQRALHHPRKPLVTFIVYNLPNRDCAAHASAGEICCKYNRDRTCDFLHRSNRCEAGIREYKRHYINPLARTLKRYCGKVPIALVIEPDSLPNLVTNLDNPKCGNPATQASIRQSVRYAVRKLKASCPKATLYLDAAHGAWLGWEANCAGFLKEVKRLNIASHLRGFALNVANYQEMGILCPKLGTCHPSSQTRNHRCCRRDACNLASQYNAGFSLLNYVMVLKETAKSILPEMDVHFLLDTGRNGVANSRNSCGNSCNVRGAGFGVLPTTNTALPGLIDAYMWLKRPGESDGCTQRLPGGGKCPRFDRACASADSIGTKGGEPRVPEAGRWFPYHLRLMARNS